MKKKRRRRKKKKSMTPRRNVQNQKSGTSLTVRATGIPSTMIKILTNTTTMAI